MTLPADDRRRWMTQFVQSLPDRATLREGDEVEIYEPKHCVGRFSDAQLDEALAIWRKRMGKWEREGKPKDDYSTRPAIVIHCGRLWVVELQTLTTNPAVPRKILVEPKRPATKQMALWE